MAGLDFRHVVLLWPVLTGLHVWEEWPGFPVWARRFASPRYSDREYVVTHVWTVGSAVAWNGCFHLAATLWSRSYCPGTVTGVALYLPFAVWVARLAVRDGVIANGWLAAAFAVALVGHVAEVGHTVFKRW
jgi:hypothetical protein